MEEEWGTKGESLLAWLQVIKMFSAALNASYGIFIGEGRILNSWQPTRQ